MRRWILGLAMLVMLCGAELAAASVVVYQGTDAGIGPGGPRPNSNAAAASFDTAAGGLAPIIDFESLSTGNFASRSIANGVTATLSGTDSSTGAGIAGITGDSTYGYNTTSRGTKVLRFVPLFDAGTATATFDFASPIDAFGAYLTGLGTANGNLHMTFSDGVSQDLSVAGSSLGGVKFFGFTDAGAQISQVTLTLRNVIGSRDIFSVDDIRFSPSAVVAAPEPAAVVVWLLLGLAVVAINQRRSRLRAA